MILDFYPNSHYIEFDEFEDSKALLINSMKLHSFDKRSIYQMMLITFGYNKTQYILNKYPNYIDAFLTNFKDKRAF